MSILKAKNSELEQLAVASEAFTRRENIVVEGLKEMKYENCINVAHKLFSDLGLPQFPLQ